MRILFLKPLILAVVSFFFAQSFVSAEMTSFSRRMEMLLHSANYILCIDGGGTKTAVCLLDKQGRAQVLHWRGVQGSEIRLGASNVNTVGEVGVQRLLEQIAEIDVTLLTGGQVATSPQSIKSLMPQLGVIAGMSGHSSAENEPLLTTFFEAQGLPTGRTIVSGDAGLALNLVDGSGAVLIAGTGSICLGINGDQRYRSGGLGWVFGDEGSGYFIGKEAIRSALAYQLGEGVATSLTPVVGSFLKTEFGVDLPTALLPLYLEGKVRPTQVAKLAPSVFKEAVAGDVVSMQIVDRAARELGDLLAAVLEDINEEGSEVYLIGGVFVSDKQARFIEKMLDSPKAKAALQRLHPEIKKEALYSNPIEVLVRKYQNKQLAKAI